MGKHVVDLPIAAMLVQQLDIHATDATEIEIAQASHSRQ